MTLSIGRQERGMMDPAIAATGGMEGGGAYNQNAAPQAAGAAVALRLLQDAARTIALPSGDEPIAVVDYGSSQGFNSIAPMRAAIESLRTRSEVGKTDTRLSRRLAAQRLQRSVWRARQGPSKLPAK
jgi:hypothetical protein